MGTQFKDAATEIEYAQMMILATLVVVVASIVRLVTAIWAGGITAGAVAARLAQQRMRITLIYRQLPQAMLRYAAVDFATGAGLSMKVTDTSGRETGPSCPPAATACDLRRADDAQGAAGS
ncbi:hypothetical protein E1292_28230 [Nonomuraea deserti]|uniref:Uncharacterized protein n=1 Tax=Nonomuraea deserti TaxID=1848322 RepID=A0A4R4VEY1_9ACTN|nr:hypothetical protein [Nonomuraea deserti]TDD00634.1 hypothetical protein E1292_28230 [Nonomuraea deserti]